MHSNSKISSDRQLHEISRKMEGIREQQGMRRFVEAGDEAKTISGFVDDIRDAILEYQVCYDGPGCSKVSYMQLRCRYKCSYTSRTTRRL